MITRNLSLTALFVACVLATSSAHAAVTISAAGTGTGFDVTNQAAWLSNDVVKTFDVDGDNVYGTAGYLMFGTTAGGANNSGQSWGAHIDALPTWASVSEPADFDAVADQFGTYVVIDDPNAGPGVSVANWTARSGIAVSNDNTGVGAWNALANFTLSAGTPENFRVGVLAGNGAGNGWDPIGVRISGPDGSIGTVSALPASSTADWVFFDVDTGGATSGTFTIESARRVGASQGSSIGGFTFDVVSSDMVTVVGSLQDNPNTAEVGRWSRTSVAKTFDIDGDDYYGTDGYTWTNDNNSGGKQAVLTSLTESVPTYLTGGIVYTGAGAGASGSFTGAEDRLNPTDTGVENVGYAGVDYASGSAAVQTLQEVFAYTMARDMFKGETIRMGIVLDSLGDPQIGADALRIVAGTALVDVALVTNSRNGSMDMYFVDIKGLSAGDEIQIWLSNATISTATFNAATIGGVTFDSFTIPTPAALPAGLAMLGIFAARRRRR